MTEFRVLGEVEAFNGGRVVDVGHARERGILAVLLVEANQVVSSDQLLERVWGSQRAPANPAGAVRMYMSLLRRALASGGDVTIARRPPGYKLVLEPRTVDLHRFRSLLAEAAAAHDELAVALMQQALGLWRGEPFAGLDTPWMNDTRQMLALERQAARLDLTDLQLRRGRHTAMLASLNAQAAEHPLDERIAGQLMLALYRSGRQAEAHEHYQRVRRRLAEDLGTDPGSALRELHQRIVSTDAALDLTSPAVAARPAAVPRQLPPEPPMFVGRTRELDLLAAVLDAEPEPGASRPVRLIGGMGGVGKSRLALRWAHQHADRFPDGQFWVDLHGFDPADEPTPPVTALRGLLGALGVDPAAAPTGLDAQIELYHSLIAGKRMLIVLDNARSSSQVVPLLPGDAGCTVLVTSRRSLADLIITHGARWLALDVLSDGDARRLLADYLGPQTVAAQPDAVAELLDHCAGLPLALSITAARAIVCLSLGALARELRPDADRLDALSLGHPRTDLRTVLSWSRRALSNDAARALALLGIAPSQDIELSAAVDLLGLPVAVTRNLLNDLARASLLQRRGLHRYRMHELIRLYAREQDPDGRDAAARTTRRIEPSDQAV